MSKLVQRVLSIEPNPKAIREVKEALKEAFLETDISQRNKFMITLAMEEAIGSIVEYGKNRNFQSEITILIDIDDVRFKAIITDSCNIFNLADELTQSQVTGKLDEEKEHKLQINILRFTMDEITYSYKKGFENELVLIKFL